MPFSRQKAKENARLLSSEVQWSELKPKTSEEGQESEGRCLILAAEASKDGFPRSTGKKGLLPFRTLFRITLLASDRVYVGGDGSLRTDPVVS